MSAPVDVLAVIASLEDLARHRLLLKRRKIDRDVAAGRDPHNETVVKCERAEYLRDQAREARAAVAELIRCSNGLQNALDLKHPHAVVVEWRSSLNAALARVQGGAA